MNPSYTTTTASSQWRRAMWVAAYSAALLAAPAAHAFTPLQQPASVAGVPANVLLSLSVEYPTGLQQSYTSPEFDHRLTYQGYFSPVRCYSYNRELEYFQPEPQAVAATGSCDPSTLWSGNLLNWLTATNLDQFRKVMTGGTRDSFSTMIGSSPGDTPDQTILIKSFSDKGPQFDPQFNSYKFMRPETPGYPRAGTAGNPNWGSSQLVVRTAGYGTKMLVRRFSTIPSTSTSTLNGGFPSFDSGNPDWQKLSCAASTGLGADTSCFNIRVRVCDRSGGKPMEPNCNATYSGQPKPEGLMQKYADRLRFGVMSYLRQSDTTRDGGVVRGPIASLGSTKATASGVEANEAPEWDLTTGVLRNNPNPADAEAVSSAEYPVRNSGVINYINQFGYLNGYKFTDQNAELYYAALLYLRGEAPPASYATIVQGLNKSLLYDGFPAVTGTNLLAGQPRDPVVNACQKNFIIGLSDLETWCDGSLPGGTNPYDCNASQPGPADTLNVETLWQTVRGMEGMTDNRVQASGPVSVAGATGWVGGMDDHATPYIAGLAHWAHTSDIRPDLPGDQTVRTFWVDVLQELNEMPDATSALQLRTPAWLAAKYGGFDKKLAGGNDPNANDASWDSNGDGIPDNLFGGNDPVSLSSGLTRAFTQIAADASAGTASAPAVSQRIEGPGTLIFSASYDPADWTGELRACRTSQTQKECEEDPVWNASDWLRPQTAPVNGITPLKPSDRKIITSWRASSTAGTFSKMPFRYPVSGSTSGLNSAQKSLINGDDSETFGKLAVDFLRGDRSKEGAEVRQRGPHVLASMVNSNITYLGRSTERYSGANFAGHKAYRDSTSSRAPVVYVGANDGKLHAFDAQTGKELFAYIPGSMFFNDKLNAQAQPAFSHQYMVDSTPMVGDFQNSSDSNNWATLLVGGLGGGGRGFYALNIKGQNTFADATENRLASELPLWEFTSAQDSDLGYTFNEPAQDSASGRFLQIAKVASSTVDKGSWVVVVGNGYGSTSGKAVLYLLNAATGVVRPELDKLEVTGITDTNGLSTPTPVDTDGDGLIDTIYAGDLLGYVHKFAFTRTDGARWVLGTPGSATGDTGWRYIGAVFRAVDGAGNAQPITTAITVGPRCGAGGGLALSAGTGKLNEAADRTDNKQQIFFTFFDTGAVQPTSQKTPLLIASSTLATITTTPGTTLANGLNILNWTAPSSSSLTSGWRLPLQSGERVLGNATLPPDTGAVLFGVTKPGADTCEAGGGGYVVAVDQCSGSITSLTFDGQVVGGFEVGGAGVVKVAPGYRMLDGKLFAGSNQKGAGGGSSASGVLTDNLAPPGRYSWREVLGF